MRHIAPFIAGFVLVSGCAEVNKTLDGAEKVISVASSPTARNVTTIARSDDRSGTARQLLQQRRDVYADNPQALITDLRQIQRDFEAALDLLRGRATKTWGKQEVKLPERTQYVKYTQNYQSRAVVNFDAGRIVVETVDEKNPKQSLRNAIVTTLLTPDDPRSVDLFSDRAVTLSSERPPYLRGLVLDQNRAEISTPQQAEAYADYLIANHTTTRAIAVDGGSHNALSVDIAMVGNLGNKQAAKYQPTVAQMAKKFNISESLIFAVIRTESNFNPFAVSHAPAYGLMQLVPTSGGREAYRKAYGKDVAPTKDELFDPDKNIEMGTAYLSVLMFNQLESVGNLVSREYCVISAYNTGPRNVLRAFNSSDRVDALNQINRLEPPAVFDKLRANLPHDETRQYLKKVVDYRRQFITAGQ